MEPKRSPLNIGRTKARNARKQERHRENVAYRASLHAQKAADPGGVKAAVIQGQIDAISQRK